jgi:hypothetical protein
MRYQQSLSVLCCNGSPITMTLWSAAVSIFYFSNTVTAGSNVNRGVYECLPALLLCFRALRLADVRQRSSNDLTLKQDRLRTYKPNMEARSCNHCCCGRAIIITYCECVSVALDIQQSTRTRHIILYSVACPAVLFFYHIVS